MISQSLSLPMTTPTAPPPSSLPPEVPALEQGGLRCLVNEGKRVTRGPSSLVIAGLDDVHRFYSEAALAMDARDLFARRLRRRVMKQIAVDAGRNQPIADRGEPIWTFGMVRAHFVQQARWMRQIGGRHLNPHACGPVGRCGRCAAPKGSNSRLGRPFGAHAGRTALFHR